MEFVNLTLYILVMFVMHNTPIYVLFLRRPCLRTANKVSILVIDKIKSVSMQFKQELTLSVGCLRIYEFVKLGRFK